MALTPHERCRSKTSGTPSRHILRFTAALFHSVRNEIGQFDGLPAELAKPDIVAEKRAAMLRNCPPNACDRGPLVGMKRDVTNAKLLRLIAEHV
jgi:hypothetical protein